MFTNNISYVFHKYDIKPKGIIHIGAHKCEERSIYNKVGVSDDNIIWIEANQDLVQFVNQNLKGVNIIQGVVSDKEEEVDFMITNNLESSSIFAFGTHSKHHPHVMASKYIKVNSITLPKLFEKNNINPSNFDMLVMDIQGAEFNALKGMESILNNFNHIYLEANEEELYVGCGLLSDIEIFLEPRGFLLLAKDIHRDFKWGDAIFARKSFIKPIKHLL